MRENWRIRLVVLILLLLTSGVIAATGQAENFVLIAHFDEGAMNPWGYDCDQDGWNELVFSTGIDTYPPISMVRAYEHTGSNNYDPAFDLLNYSFLAVGDLDGDDLTDAVARAGWFPAGYDTIDIFESLSPNSYPEELVWSGTTLYHMEPEDIRITDLDQDGRKEMLRFRLGRMRIFECTGDNSYEPVFQDSVGGDLLFFADLCTGDFDQDGRLEFVVVDGWDRLRAWENTEVGVDSFAVTWDDTLIDSQQTWEIAGANDMDGDGLSEFVVVTYRGGGRCLIVFEAAGDNEYEPVWSDTIIGLTWPSDVACGDVDGDGVDEICLGFEGERILLYKCVGPDSYELIWEEELVTTTGWDILIYDLNDNGYGEIIVANSPDGIWIYEKEIIGVEEFNDQLAMTKSQLFQNYPNPFTSLTAIRYSLFAQDGGEGANSQKLKAKSQHVVLKVYDLSGRLVRSLVDGEKGPGSYTAIWNGRDEGGRAVSAGVYFCQLTVGIGEQASKLSRKLVVVR